jgi:hypothetical protein
MKKLPLVIATMIAVGATVLFVFRQESPTAPSTPPTVVPPPLSIETPVRFTVKQRSTTPLPGSEKRILITLDDITRGQVLTTLAWDDGRPIAATRSLRKGEILPFTIESHRYTLTVLMLKNVLIGEDHLEFELAPAAASAQPLLSVDERIELLIQALAKLENATFIRNGEEHSVAEAVAHMRSKWEWKKRDIKTIEDFITLVGSKSSISGDPYLIKRSDGQTLRAEDWIREQLTEKAP